MVSGGNTRNTGFLSGEYMGADEYIGGSRSCDKRCERSGANREGFEAVASGIPGAQGTTPRREGPLVGNIFVNEAILGTSSGGRIARGTKR